MKKKIFYFFIPVVIMMASCAKDNYDMPDQSLTGRIVYDGEPINVEYDQVKVELWESGWQLRTPINMMVKQDGSFSAVLFKGSYKLVIPAGNGPFIPTMNETTQSDTIILNLDGSKTLDIAVTPFYMVRNTQISKNGNAVNASFALEKVITNENAKDIEEVFLYLNKTQFVSSVNNVASSRIAGGDIADLSSIALTVDIPEIVPSQNYVYARVGVRIAGVRHMLFSSVQKLEF